MKQENEFDYQRRYVPQEPQKMDNSDTEKKGKLLGIGQAIRNEWHKLLQKQKNDHSNLFDDFKLIDKPIFIIMLVLLTISIVMSYSSTMYLTENGISPNPFDYMRKQVIAILIGLVGYFMVMLVPKPLFKAPIVIVIGNSIVILLLIYTIVFGRIGGGAQSWINIAGYNLQPGEMSKIAAIFSMSLYISYNKPLFYRKILISREPFFGNITWRPVIIIAMIILQLFLINLQPDLGMVFIILSALFVVHNVSYLKYDKLIKRLGVGVFTLVCLYTAAFLLGPWLVSTGNYRLERIGAFVNPFAFPNDSGYQLIRAYIAMSRGGLFGTGIGRSLTKMENLPAGHTDYILAVITEEFGFVGAVVLLLLLLALIVSILRWAARSRDIFRKAFFTGVSVMLFVQMVFNIGGVLGVVPLTGVTLPLISYGGSSILMTILLLGIVQALIIDEKHHEQNLLKEEVA